jgi:hypothetical protein
MENSSNLSSEDVVKKVLAHVHKMLQAHKAKAGSEVAKNSSHVVEEGKEPNSMPEQKVDEKQPHKEGESAEEHKEHEDKESPAEEAAEHAEGEPEAEEKEANKENIKEDKEPESEEEKKKKDKKPEFLVKKSEEMNDLQKKLFPEPCKGDVICCDESKKYEPTKADICRDLNYKMKDLKDMKDMVWSIKDEISEEAKEVMEKAFEKLKKEIEELAKKYPEALAKNEGEKVYASKELVKFLNKKHNK